MSSRCSRAALVLVGLLVTGPAQAQVTITPYLWEFPHVHPSSVTATSLVTRLRTEVQRILDAGPELAPAYMYHGDVAMFDQYWVYTIPGRSLTTMAWAYPYLSASQQTAAQSYVTTLLASSTHAPWSTSPLTPATGSLGSLHPMTRTTYVSYGSFAGTYPSVQTIYGLWLWGWRRGGNWSDLTAYQSTIRSMYTSRAGQGNIYGTAGAHIAKARLESAQIWNNSSNQTTASNNLQTALNDGLTFSTIESRVSTSPGYWAVQYTTTRKQNGQYLGWMFLDASPEIARYIANENITAALTRHAAGKTKYPLWWLRQAPYNNGLTGTLGADTEAGGLTPEVIGMIAPLERYTIGASAATMARYARSGPATLADLYYIELLVYAIEASGTTNWVDVRDGFPADPGQGSGSSGGRAGSRIRIRLQ